MLGRFPLARRTSTATLAAALVAGVIAPAAQAQDDAPQVQNTNRRGNAPAQTPPKSGNSQEFANVYQPLAAIANAPTGDFASAKAQVPTLLAAVQNADDRNLAGNLLLILGNKTSDRVLQRQGLQMMLESGKVEAAKTPQIQFLLGNLAYEAKDYPAARAALEAARSAGYQDEGLNPLLAETYFSSNQPDQGLALLKTGIAAKRAAGAPVPDIWLRRGLQVVYDRKQVAQTNEWAALLVSTNPTPANWTTALQVVNQINPFDQQARLDLYRLMLATNSLANKDDYFRYVDAADARVMSNEVGRVLQAGVSAGAVSTSDTEYKTTKQIVDLRSAADRAEAPKLAALARSSGKATDALNAGDVLYSLGQYGDAEEMYNLAAGKGGADKDKALTRLGIAQAQQNKTAEAKATFAQVSGTRAAVAQMWQAYLSTKA